MEMFRLMSEHDHEQLVFCHEPSANYRGIIAIHDTTLGPALGGTRVWTYRSEAEAGDIYDTLLRVFEIAKREKIPTCRAADRLGEKRIEAVRKLKRTWL